MRALVTGGAGFIGSHLVDRLRALGWTVDVIDSVTGPSIQETNAIPHGDAIFHLASPVGPVGVLGWAGRLVEEVVTTTAIVRDWALANDCPLVNVSTSEVYGSGSHDAETDECRFAPAASARKEYAIAKLAAETMLLNSPVRVRIIRPFNVAGPGQKPEGGFVLPRFIEQARAGRPITVYAPGSQRRAFTHVSDIVEGIALSLNGSPGEVYNLGNPVNQTSIAALARRVIEAIGSSSHVEIIDPRSLWGPAFREAPDKLPDATKAIHDLGWNPTRDLDAIIRDAAFSPMAAAA